MFGFTCFDMERLVDILYKYNRHGNQQLDNRLNIYAIDQHCICLFVIKQLILLDFC